MNGKEKKNCVFYFLQNKKCYRNLLYKKKKLNDYLDK